MTFIPGFSTLKGQPQDPEENAKTYAESQQQRALERKLREEKRDLEVMKAQGADPEAIKTQKQRVNDASHDIDAFCEETGRARRRDREAAPVRATWPTENGEVTRFNGGYIGTNETPPEKRARTTEKVASQATIINTNTEQLQDKEPAQETPTITTAKDKEQLFAAVKAEYGIDVGEDVKSLNFELQTKRAADSRPYIGIVWRRGYPSASLRSAASLCGGEPRWVC